MKCLHRWLSIHRSVCRPLGRLNCCWPSPAQWFLIPPFTGLMTIFYTLTDLGAFRPSCLFHLVLRPESTDSLTHLSHTASHRVTRHLCFRYLRSGTYITSALLCGRYRPWWTLASVYSSLIIQTVGRIPWTGDQPAARPLHTQENTTRVKAKFRACNGIRTQTPVLSGRRQCMP
jgi:hypothetical protein